MAEDMKAIGKIIICMGKEFIHGVMEENMMEVIIWTKNMAMVYIIGQMVVNMKDNGQMVDNMEKASTLVLIPKLEEVYGKTVNELNG